MAFCRFCGSQIEDGTVCPCQQNVQQQAAPQAASADFTGAPVQNSAPAAQGNAAADVATKVLSSVKTSVNTFIPYLKAYIKAPKATVHDAVVGGKLAIAGGFFALNAVAIIVALWSLLSAAASLTGMIGAKLDLPVFRMIFGGILISAVIITLAAVALFIFAKIGKSGLNFKGALIACALHSFWPTVLVFGGTIIGLIGGIFGLFIAVAAVSFAVQMVLVTAISDARSLGGCDVTSSSGKMFLVPLVLILANAAIGLIASTFFAWCISGVSVNGYDIGGIGNFVENIFY